MHVSDISIILISINIGIGVAAPVLLFYFLNRKYRVRFKTFLAGMTGMFVFAMLLEQLFHTAVLSSPVGEVITGNFWLYAIYGGLAAGVFEETGRFVIMKFLLKDEHDYDANALMYGAGHGGLELMYILIMGMINNLIYAIMINSGEIEKTLESVDGDVLATMQAAITSLCSASPATFLLAPVERFGALVAQIALSVLVWFAVTRAKDRLLFPLAILLHFLLDAGSVILMNLGIPVPIIEAIIWVMAVAYAILAKKLWDERVNPTQIDEKKKELMKVPKEKTKQNRRNKPVNIAEKANLNKRKK